MAREIVIWCDPHIAQDERVTGEDYTLALNGSPRVIALCVEHRKELLDPLATLVEEHGILADSIRRRGGGEAHPSTGAMRKGRQVESRPYVCPLCPLDYAGMDALAKHIEKIHYVTPGRDLFGKRCALCGFVSESFQGVGQHVLRSHDQNFSAALRTAMQTGTDPFDVIAEIKGRAATAHFEASEELV